MKTGRSAITMPEDTAILDRLFEQSDTEQEGEGNDEEHRLARLLVGGRLRRRRLRRLMLAHLLRERVEDRGAEDEGIEDEGEEEDGGEDHRLARLLIGKGALRRRRLRRLLLAHLL